MNILSHHLFSKLSFIVSCYNLLFKMLCPSRCHMFLVTAMDWIGGGEGWEEWIIKLIGFDLACLSLVVAKQCC